MTDQLQRDRDAQIARVLGSFLCLIALPVLFGTFGATLAVDRWINAVAGFVLLAIGIGFLVRAGRA